MKENRQRKSRIEEEERDLGMRGGRNSLSEKKEK
jgi:hypothetical protein